MATGEMISLWTFPLEAAAGCEKVLLAMLILEAKCKWHFHRNKFFKAALLDCENPIFTRGIWLDPCGTVPLPPTVQWSNFHSWLRARSHVDGNLEQRGWGCSAGLPRPISAHSELRGRGNWVGLGWLCHVPGSHAQQGPDTARGFRRALVFLCPCSAPWCVGTFKGALVFISAQHPALVHANPLFSQVYED